MPCLALGTAVSVLYSPNEPVAGREGIDSRKCQTLGVPRQSRGFTSINKGDARMAIIAQRRWRWCQKCGGLWYSGASADPDGVCAAGGGHSQAGSADYALFCDPDGNFSANVFGQRRWRWCQKCGGLWYSGFSADRDGTCPAGGGHSQASSGDYALLGAASNLAANGFGQRRWRWCQKCGGLWYSGSSADPDGTCPAGGGHSQASSGDYALFGDPDGNLSD